MTTRLQLVAALVIVQLTAGCGAVSPPMPSSPSPAVASAPTNFTGPPVRTGFVPNITLSGVVFEMVQDQLVPIQGVAVYCELCGEGTHSWASTDSKGFYRFTGLWGNYFPISVEKAGYQDPPGTRSTTGWGPGWRDVTINGDTRFDVELVKK
jgi:hypothetical protein